MESYAKNVLVSLKVKLMECWADSAWLCIFHFWKCVTWGINAPFENKAADPFHLSWVSLWHSFFLFLSFSQAGSFEHRGSLSSLFLPGLLKPNREAALHLRSIQRVHVASVNRANPVSGTLLAFCVNQGISASFSLLYFSLLPIPFFLRVSLEGAGAGPKHTLKVPR